MALTKLKITHTTYLLALSLNLSLSIYLCFYSSNVYLICCLVMYSFSVAVLFFILWFSHSHTFCSTYSQHLQLRQPFNNISTTTWHDVSVSYRNIQQPITITTATTTIGTSSIFCRITQRTQRRKKKFKIKLYLCIK